MKDRPEIVFYLARADNGVIGSAKDLPWRLPPDLKRFKKLTMGKAMVMGRKTFESFGGPLPGRRHIVITRSREWEADGAEVVHDPEEALIHAEDAPEIAIVGGGEIYSLLLPRADRIELTEVHIEPDGDTLAPDFPDSDWREIEREDFPATDDLPAYSFVTLVRR
ncbi:MAG: dihydrofolate reductase [Parasphingopyxis sp.]|uniref:dihydrofolate reductase n=1 Tax=Parasphingopyxis sp. TaxID=1920299 RepID=UPI0032F066E0